MTIRRPAMSEEKYIVIEEMTDPEEIARVNTVMEQGRRNWDWLENHWPDVLPQAYDKYIAVAGQQPFIADDPEQARAAAKAAHPDDRGVIVQYVSSHKGPRVYAHRR